MDPLVADSITLDLLNQDSFTCSGLAINRIDLELSPEPEELLLDSEQSELYQQFQKRFTFTLDPFQKYAILGLLRHVNVLVTVPTSSGNTVIAEFGIFQTLHQNQKMGDSHSIGEISITGGLRGDGDSGHRHPSDTPPINRKRVIYTSPIKTLSNQKYSEFRQKFDTQDIGIITGDVKFNPEATCLIMTTEILRDLLFRQDSMIATIGCVVFDEVHYINNEDRGRVWEQCLMLLPPSVSLILLSATISKPERFAQWITDIKQKTVRLIVHSTRTVQLTHLLYTPPNRCRQYFSSDSQLHFNYQLYQDYHDNWKYRDERATVNSLIEHLAERDLHPALFFIFSRRKCELLAEQTIHRFHDPATMAQIEKMIDCTLAQYQYDFHTLSLTPQVQTLKRLAQRGIGFHHSGLLPFVKETVEKLFATGFIKILFVTETFSVGINMPTRTVVFTDLTKRVNGKIRALYTDEFYQMAGRAGRRGLDTEGYVIYSPTQRIMSLSDHRKMLEGSPMSITSHYTTDYELTLELISSNLPFSTIQQSYIYQSINREIAKVTAALPLLQEKITLLEGTTEMATVTATIDPQNLNRVKQYLLNKQELNAPEEIIGGFRMTRDQKQTKALRKQLDNDSQLLIKDGLLSKSKQPVSPYREHLDRLEQLEIKTSEVDKLQQFLQQPDKLFHQRFVKCCEDLLVQGYLSHPHTNTHPLPTTNHHYSLSTKGMIAAQVRTCNGLLVANMIENRTFDRMLDYSVEYLGLGLSILVADLSNGITSLDDLPDDHFKTDQTLKWFCSQLSLADEDLVSRLPLYQSKEYFFDLVTPLYFWLQGETYLRVSKYIGDLAGNFVRSCLRLLHLVEELQRAFNLTGTHIHLLKPLTTITERVHREIVVFDSIYIK